MKKFMKLSRAEMKGVLGGLYGGGPGGPGEINPNCEGTSGTEEYTCCGPKGAYLIGTTTCLDASARCNGSMITNDPSRCEGIGAPQ
jgi:hypothetical protein